MEPSVHQTWGEYISSEIGGTVFLILTLPVLIPLALALRLFDPIKARAQGAARGNHVG